MEDGVYLSRGELAPSNAALVTKARRIIEDLGGTLASTAEARAMLFAAAGHPVMTHIILSVHGSLVLNLAASAAVPFETPATPAPRLLTKATDIESLAPDVETGPLVLATEDEVVVRVHAAAVNPSDVKAATGLMPYAVIPSRTPGRDFARHGGGGPPARADRKEVFGSSGDLGIRRDGSHGPRM